MSPPRYIYQRSGGPLVTWNRMRPPGQSRAADAVSLGSLGGSDVFDRPRRLPRGGAPEYISDGFGASAIEYGEPVYIPPPPKRARKVMRAMADDAAPDPTSTLADMGKGLLNIFNPFADASPPATTPTPAAPAAPASIPAKVGAMVGMGSTAGLVILAGVGYGAFRLITKKGR